MVYSLRVGESEKLVRALFEMARERAPSVIFFDEIDALLSSGHGASNESSRRLLTQFLIEFDGVKSDAESNVFVMGATNRPEALDEGVRRRLTKRIYIPLPCIRARLALITSLLDSVKHQLTESDCEHVARVLEGYSGSDVTAVVKDAAMEPLRELPTESIRRTRKFTHTYSHIYYDVQYLITSLSLTQGLCSDARHVLGYWAVVPRPDATMLTGTRTFEQLKWKTCCAQPQECEPLQARKS